MRRREFVAGLGSVAAWPCAVQGQQPVMPVVGFLTSESSGDTLWREFVAAFRGGLSDIGYIEGRNVAFEFRSSENNNDRLPALALELVRRQVAVIVTRSTATALAAKTATTTIPIVFGSGADPVKLGLVASLNRPGANVTDITGLTRGDRDNCSLLL
jgi:putative tryptophan/tyrosine transport system substrate-binding protein